jgi:hypothetical protein
MATLRSIGEIGRKMMVTAAALGTLLIGACGITEPEENPWQDVSKFSWPQNTSVTMKYRVTAIDALDTGKLDAVVERTMSVKQSNVLYNGQPMFVLTGDVPDPRRSLPVLYLATRDTLITKDAMYGGDFALVAPLEKGHSWISAYRRDGVASWKATIVEKLSLLKLNGIEYSNVIGVKYEKINLGPTEGAQHCLRYYAEGRGLIKEIGNRYNSKDNDQLSIAVPATTDQQELLQN